LSGVAAPRGPAVLALLFNAFAWGVSWWPFRALAERGLHPLWLTALVYAAAVLVLLAARPGALGELLRTPSLWVLVTAAGLTNACFNWGVTIGDVVRVVLLFYLMPLWAVLLARLLLGERIGGRAAARIALALTGAAVVLWPGSSPLAARPGLADALALLGGLSFALNNVMLRREARRAAGRCRRRRRPAGCSAWRRWRRGSWRRTSHCSTAPHGCRRTPPRW
jgi:drug/metabolite transporter (DMT)-like permease